MYMNNGQELDVFLQSLKRQVSVLSKHPVQSREQEQIMGTLKINLQKKGLFAKNNFYVPANLTVNSNLSYFVSARQAKGNLIKQLSTILINVTLHRQFKFQRILYYCIVFYFCLEWNLIQHLQTTQRLSSRFDLNMFDFLQYR